MIDSSVGVGCKLHVGDDGMVVAVNDEDFEQVDVASVWLDIRVTW
jgi:hypothetical protein